jgi:beta-glucanase (GH16 family)
MHLAFSEDFKGSSLDTTRWATCFPWWGGCTIWDKELEWYLPSQARVSDGALHLDASRTPTVGSDQEGKPKNYDWRSGMVTTNDSFSFTYGYVEIEARVAEGDGMWSTLWLLSKENGPAEIDIAEFYGNDPHALSVVLHPRSGGKTSYRNVNTSDLSARWHTYAVDWKPDSITWYLDGKPVYRYKGAKVPREPMYFLATLAVGNVGFVRPTPWTPSASSLIVRRVAIYQR